MMNEGFSNEPDEEDFEDKVLPIATPVYLQQPSEPTPSINSAPSYDSSQFDPFAPQTNSSTNTSNTNDAALDLLSVPSTIGDAPVLQPMNPDADGDLLGGETFVPKHASKDVKDPKMKHLLYDQDDDDHDALLQANANNKNENADNFEDDDDDDDDGNAKRGGWFSPLRIRKSPNNKLAANSTDEANTETLEVGGNSLPHPDTLKAGSSRDYVEEDEESDGDSSVDSSDSDHSSDSKDGDESDEDGLDGNGKSLPHPEEIRSTKLVQKKQKEEIPDETILDENGMSLPHPETMKSVTNHSHDNSRLIAALEAAGNELNSDDDDDKYMENNVTGSDDDEKLYDGSESSSSESGTEHYLDHNGNSLPHPDEHAIHKNSGHGRSSFKWGNVKRNLKSTFSKRKSDIESLNDDEDEEDGRFIGKTDEEMGHYEDSGSDSDSDFSDEDSTSPKARMLKLLNEHKDNPRSRMICLASLILFILLFIVTPVAVNKRKAKNLDSDGPMATQPPSFSTNGAPCYDEIVLTDRDGNDLVNGTHTSEDFACYSVDEPIHFRFKRCRPASPLDWVGIFSSRSLFMDKLWKDHHDGMYLCGDQPCPKDDPYNKEGGPPRVKTTRAPPIKEPGEYRLFLVKDSDWPYEFVKHTAAFHVVDSSQTCANKDNIFGPPKTNGGSVYVDVPTAAPTADATGSGTLSSIGTRE